MIEILLDCMSCPCHTSGSTVVLPREGAASLYPVLPLDWLDKPLELGKLNTFGSNSMFEGCDDNCAVLAWVLVLVRVASLPELTPFSRSPPPGSILKEAAAVTWNISEALSSSSSIFTHPPPLPSIPPFSAIFDPTSDFALSAAAGPPFWADSRAASLRRDRFVQCSRAKTLDSCSL
jgi:hypothetical protein